MPQTTSVNRRVVLASRPQGAPTSDNFRLEAAPVPTPAEGEVLLRTVFLSLDPYMRGRMSDEPSYAAPVVVGEVMVGGTVSRVEASHHEGFSRGDLVLSYSGWQDYAISNGKGLTRLSPSLVRPSQALGVLGMPGFTAYMGLLDIGKPQPGETVVVAAAAGAVGSAVGQIAKLKGCRAVGVAGGDAKCRYVVEELGFDACVDHRSASLRAELAAACPQGIDVYFENVAGAVLEAVIPLLNTHARIPLCGHIAYYNDAARREGPDKLPTFLRALLTKRALVRGFIITLDYGDRFGEFFREMSEWVGAGKIKDREDLVDGLENAPTALMGLLQGKNFGKVVVRVGPNES